MKKHNFNAGPSILSEYTIKSTAESILDLNGIGFHCRMIGLTG